MSQHHKGGDDSDQYIGYIYSCWLTPCTATMSSASTARHPSGAKIHAKGLIQHRDSCPSWWLGLTPSRNAAHTRAVFLMVWLHPVIDVVHLQWLPCIAIELPTDVTRFWRTRCPRRVYCTVLCGDAGCHHAIRTDAYLNPCHQLFMQFGLIIWKLTGCGGSDQNAEAQMYGCCL